MHPDNPSGRADLLAGGARHHRELPVRRQQLHRQAGQFRAVHRSGAATRAVLVAHERTSTHPERTSMSRPLRILIVEDSEDDTQLLLHQLRRGGYDPMHERVDSAATMEQALARQQWDLVIADYGIPNFNSMAALALLKERGHDLPFIIVSGTITEETAVATMKAGAHDYLLKGNLTRLIPTIERGVHEAESRRERRRAEEALQKSQDLKSSIIQSAL